MQRGPPSYSKLALLALSLPTSLGAPPIITDSSGLSYAGLHDSVFKQDYFLGIPFAQPPVGSLRFRPPVPWFRGDTRVVNATQHGLSDSEHLADLELMSILGKPTKTAKKLPVMVWIYGGAFYAGGIKSFPGNHLVERSTKIGKPIVYVAMNYRVGIYGFPPGQAAQDAGASNLGLKDQRFALEWIQKNIVYFGGDPNKLDSYYQALIGQAPTIFTPTRSPDDDFFTDIPSKLLRAGKFAKVPFINGAQLDEGTIFVNGTSLNTEQDIVNWATAHFTGLDTGITNETAVRELLKYYPDDPAAGSPYGTDNETFGQGAQYKRYASMVGDLIFQAPRRDHLRKTAKFGVKSWSYIFAERPLDFLPHIGIKHSGEILFVLQFIGTVNPNASPEQLSFTQAVGDYWSLLAFLWED
ncbi:hypothetical protein FRC07_011950 [Ceratobasidium sp. 392]|nr:hypothetical protein FRC07_011950 [Ceratobasidium sp. 392]